VNSDIEIMKKRQHDETMDKYSPKGKKPTTFISCNKSRLRVCLGHLGTERAGRAGLA
jgi:hypothetical protein